MARLCLSALFVLLVGVSGCRILQRESTIKDASFSSLNWTDERRSRNDFLTKYLAEHADAAFAFRFKPVGSDGVPAMLLGLLGEIAPESWSKSAASRAMGFTYEEKGSGQLPNELNLGPRFDGGPMVATFSCGSCHLGRVIDAEGHTMELVGAPNTQIDTTAYRYNLAKTLVEDRVNAAAIRSLLRQKPVGWFYGEGHEEAEARDRELILANPEGFLSAIRSSVKAREDLINRALGSHTYREAQHLLRGGVPGSLDAFGFTVLSLVVGPKLKSHQDTGLTSEDLAVLPSAPPMVDIMSVWRQSGKKYSQWDGTIENQFIRNIGAELGVIRDPSKVDRYNAELATTFISNLPSPTYPFAVDGVKATRGAQIYGNVCERCHANNAFVSIETLGVDPNRARGLNQGARIGLIAGLRDACGLANETRCQVSDNEVLLDRSSSLGYQAPSLSGIWARSPYLHNGSVPTLFHLLVPSTRPPEFVRGDLHFDQEKVGFIADARAVTGTKINTTWPGFSNIGHDNIEVFFGGINFEKDVNAREDLIEYLKTL